MDFFKFMWYSNYPNFKNKYSCHNIALNNTFSKEGEVLK